MRAWCCVVAASVMCAPVQSATIVPVGAWFQKRTLVMIHKRAFTTAELLDSQAQKLGSTRLGALALRFGQVAAAQENATEAFRSARNLMNSMLHSATQPGTAVLQEFCKAEVKRAAQLCSASESKKKAAEAELGKLVAQADQDGKEIAKRQAGMVASQQAKASAQQVRNQQHASFLRRLPAVPKEAKPIANMSINNIGNIFEATKEQRARSAAVLKRMSLETEDAAALAKYTHDQHVRDGTIKVKGEEARKWTQTLSKLKVTLMQRAQQTQGIEAEVAKAQQYKQQIDKKCNGAQKQVNRTEELLTLKTAFSVITGENE